MSESIHLVCPNCDAVNRVPNERVHNQPKCGKCHQLVFSAQPVELTTGNFKKHITRNDIPVVVDFWAPWCGPCKMMAPAFAQAAGEMEPAVRFAKVNTENEQAIAAQFGIRSIPTMILFRNGEIVGNQPGAMGGTDIVRWVRSHL